MENWKELLASFGLWLLVEDISDDGDGEGDNLQLTKEGEEASRMIKQLLEERSFSKEELERINKRVNEYDEDRYEDELDRQIVEKVDRLLNLNNKRK